MCSFILIDRLVKNNYLFISNVKRRHLFFINRLPSFFVVCKIRFVTNFYKYCQISYLSFSPLTWKNGAMFLCPVARLHKNWSRKFRKVWELSHQQILLIARNKNSSISGNFDSYYNKASGFFTDRIIIQIW